MGCFNSLVIKIKLYDSNTSSIHLNSITLRGIKICNSMKTLNICVKTCKENKKKFCTWIIKKYL